MNYNKLMYKKCCFMDFKYFLRVSLCFFRIKLSKKRLTSIRLKMMKLQSPPFQMKTAVPAAPYGDTRNYFKHDYTKYFCLINSILIRLFMY